MLRKVAITITVKPEHYRRNTFQLYEMLFKATVDLFTELADTWEFVIELTSKGVPHVHAWARMNQKFIGKLKTEKGYNIKFQNIVSKYKIVPIFGHCLLKWITDEPKWEEYMNKDIETTKEVLMDSGCILEGDPIIKYSSYLHNIYKMNYEQRQFMTRISGNINPLFD